MALPITVPFTFANATTTQNLSSLDADFSTVYNAVNGIGNGTVALSNVNITGGNFSGSITPTANSISISALQTTGTANSNTYLRGDGSWANVAAGGGSGTVTSVNAASANGFSFTGGPVTTSGTLTLNVPNPGTSGNVLTSNGTSWVSQAASGGGGSITVGTAQSATGTAITFTGIPSNAKQVILNFNQVSLSTSDSYVIQVGTSSGITTTGYYGYAGKGGTNSPSQIGAQWPDTYAQFSYLTASSQTVYQQSGTIIFNYMGNNLWCISGMVALNDASRSTLPALGLYGAGIITTSSALDRIKITTATGTTTFTGGSFNIAYQ